MARPSKISRSVVGSVKELLAAYNDGVRDFSYAQLDGANLAGMNLKAASFYEASLRGANLDDCILTYVQLKGADLTGASLLRARLNATDLIATDFSRAGLRNADLTGACLASANCSETDLRSVHFNNTNVTQADFSRSNLANATLNEIYFGECDVRPFCDEHRLVHSGPCSLDARTVMKSYPHDRLKVFMTDCGVPEIFATFMIDCAEASSEALMRSLMQSTFISYGGPDEPLARKIYEALRAHRVTVFFFPETAKVGERIEKEVYRQLQRHDRVLLLCSRNSLDRPGVVSEIRETLEREMRDGGATYLLPITVDDYVYTGWKKTHPELAERLERRVIADFRKARRSRRLFEGAMTRVLDALKNKSALKL